MKSLWRIDSEYENLEFVEGVDDKAPLGVWLYPLLGDGCYAYFETKEEASEKLIEVLENKVWELYSKIEGLKEDQK
jgi:hypothetical protein